MAHFFYNKNNRYQNFDRSATQNSKDNGNNI